MCGRGGLLARAAAAALDFCRSSSVHGLRYVAGRGVPWPDRVLWTALVALSWVGAGFMMRSAYDAYLLEPTKFVVDTAYLDWNTVFPAVTICERSNSSRLTEFTKRRFGGRHSRQIALMLETLAYDSPSELRPSFCRRAGCPTANYSDILAQIHRPCEEILRRCWWNGEPFSCCQYAMPLKTDMASCFSINSGQAQGNESDRTILTCNHTTGPGSLKLEVQADIKVYVHSRDEVPHSKTQLLTAEMQGLGKLLRHVVRVREARYEPAVARVGVARRGCRLPRETPLHPPPLYPVYSRGACVAACRAHRQLELCNCTPPLTPRLPGTQECDLAGLECVQRSADQWSEQAPAWAPAGSGLRCDCPLACLDADVDSVHQRYDNITGQTSFYELQLSHLPTERDFRLVANDGLSLVVSVGGAAGLFAGASLLSFVEAPFYLCVRPRCCAARRSPPPPPPPRLPFLP